MSAEPELAIQVMSLPPPLVVPPGAYPPDVGIDARLLQGLEEHAASSPHCEVGGLLFGQADVGGSRLQLMVTGALPAESFDAGPLHLTFTHETWNRLRRRRAAEYAGDLVVGWYHTHPGLGVFLSGLDLGLHARIFAVQPWCVALVLDPVRRRRAFFWPRGDQVHRCAEIVGAAGWPTGGRRDGIPDAENRH